MSGTLYLIPCTLGESGVDTVLPQPVLARVRTLDYFVAENAKSARAFLKAVGMTRPLTEMGIETLASDTPQAELDRMLEPLREERDAGLLSEAGAPAVADPGASLVRRAHTLGIQVRPLVGPSSILLALMASGLEGQRFAFHGYLPVEDAPLAVRIRELEQRSRSEKETQIFIETPYRNDRLLRALLAMCAPRTLLCVATHLSLDDEEVRTQPVEAWRKNTPTLGKRPSVFLLLA